MYDNVNIIILYITENILQRYIVYKYYIYIQVKSKFSRG